LLPLIISSITLKLISGESKHCTVTRNGTFKSGLQDDSLKFHPMYGISLPLAAVKLSLVSSNSDIFLTTTPVKFVKNLWIWSRLELLCPTTPLLNDYCRLVNSTSFSDQSYHCGMLSWCQMTYKGTITRVQGLISFVWEVRNCSTYPGQCFLWQARLQYFTALHFERCKSFALSKWTWPQPLHWWDL